MDRERYSRQLILPEIGASGQERLLNSTVLVVGAGGLGAPVLLYLAAAGVGCIRVADDDVVALSNLQRQVLYTVEDVGKAKVDCARKHLLALNPQIQVEAVNDRVTEDNVHSLARGCDVLIDGTDNLEARYVLSDVGVALDIPVVYGAVYRFEGQISVLGGAAGPCYRCLYPTMPSPELMPSCADGGVIGPLPGLIGSMQALEVMKCLLGIGSTLAGRLLLVDGQSMDVSTIKFKQRLDCPACGNARGISEPSVAIRPCVDRAPTMSEAAVGSVITTDELSALLLSGDNALRLLDIRSGSEHRLGNIGGDQIDLHSLQNGGFTDTADDATILITYCRTGQKSRFAADYLREQGFKDVRSLSGGLLAWQEDIDPTLQL